MIFSCTEFRRLLFGFQGAPPLLRSAAALTAGGLLLVAPAAAAEFFLWMGWIVVILSVPALLPGKGSGGHARLRPLLLLFPAAAAICLVAFRHDRLAIWAAAIWAAATAAGFLSAACSGKMQKWNFSATLVAALFSAAAAILPPLHRAEDLLALAPWYGIYFTAVGLFTPTIMKR